MGCTSSVISPGEEEQTKIVTKRSSVSKDNKTATSNVHKNGHNKNVKSNEINHWKNQNVDKNDNKLSPSGQTPVPKSIAFDVTLDGKSGDGLLNIKKRQPRLQSLEPLNLPRLTPEQLQEKQRLADDKREMLKQRKINNSRKSSRRRRELLEAREFDQKQLNEQDKDVIDDMKQAELKREQHLIEIKEKQRLREEKAKRARERAKHMQNPEDDIEVEKDEEFNAAIDDTWLGVPDKTTNNDMEDEYEPQKKVGQVRPTVSASTVDSYDAAFMRSSTQEKANLPTVHHLQNNVHIMNDDFFDS